MDQSIAYKFAVDLDDVIAGFAKYIIQTARLLKTTSEFPQHFSEVSSWDMGPGFEEVFNEVKHNPEWWLGMPPNECVLPFPDIKVTCYITSRPIASEVSKLWVNRNGFPDAPVYTVSKPSMKVAVAEREGITHFVDDKPSTVWEVNQAGIKAFLYRTPANRHERTALECISSLTELYDFLGVCKGC